MKTLRVGRCMYIRVVDLHGGKSYGKSNKENDRTGVVVTRVRGPPPHQVIERVAGSVGK